MIGFRETKEEAEEEDLQEEVDVVSEEILEEDLEDLQEEVDEVSEEVLEGDSEDLREKVVEVLEETREEEDFEEDMPPLVITEERRLMAIWTDREDLPVVEVVVELRRALQEEWECQWKLTGIVVDVLEASSAITAAETGIFLVTALTLLPLSHTRTIYEKRFRI